MLTKERFHILERFGHSDIIDLCAEIRRLQDELKIIRDNGACGVDREMARQGLQKNELF